MLKPQIVIGLQHVDIIDGEVMATRVCYNEIGKMIDLVSCAPEFVPYLDVKKMRADGITVRIINNKRENNTNASVHTQQ